MKSKIIADIAVIITLALGFIWLGNNLPFPAKAQSLSESFAVLITVWLIMLVTIISGYKIIKWIHK